MYKSQNLDLVMSVLTPGLLMFAILEDLDPAKLTMICLSNMLTKKGADLSPKVIAQELDTGLGCYQAAQQEAIARKGCNTAEVLHYACTLWPYYSRWDKLVMEVESLHHVYVNGGRK